MKNECLQVRGLSLKFWDTCILQYALHNHIQELLRKCMQDVKTKSAQM